uniref:Uncharacterized protein n=1 Tax=Arundo donax TaxID=35708 RepID=A0A0A9AR63_ARUDO
MSRPKVAAAVPPATVDFTMLRRPPRNLSVVVPDYSVKEGNLYC